MGFRVLLIDDEPEFVDALAGRLKVRGFDVRTANSGDDGLVAVGAEPPDVVVLDVVMPGMDGIETLRQLKQQAPLVEVIMLTGRATVETAIEGMKLGAFDYLMKPTEIAELIEKMDAAYARKAEQEERIRERQIQDIVRRKSW